MSVKSAIGFVLSLLIPFAIGCQQDFNKDVTALHSVDGVAIEEEPYIGDLIIAGADEKFTSDSFVLNNAVITDDALIISVSYSGGCKDHQFTLVVSEAFLESSPVQLSAYVAHDADGDPCEAWPTEAYYFDLAPVKTLYQNAYRQKAGTIVLRLKDAPNGELIYKFTM